MTYCGRAFPWMLQCPEVRRDLDSGAYYSEGSTFPRCGKHFEKLVDMGFSCWLLGSRRRDLLELATQVEGFELPEPESMHLLIVNPNTTASMTLKIEQAASAVALPSTRISAVTSEAGPESIEGYYDEALSVAGVLAEIRKDGSVDAVVLACFDDTGL